MIERIRNMLKLFSVKRDEVIYTCIQNQIPLTKENMDEVREILEQKEKAALLLEFKSRITNDVLGA